MTMIEIKEIKKVREQSIGKAINIRKDERPQRTRLKNLCAVRQETLVLTQVTEQLHSQRGIDEEEKHEEKTQIPHLQGDKNDNNVNKRHMD